MGIEKIASQMASIRPIQAYEQAQTGGSVKPTKSTDSFSDVFGEALLEVDQLQKDADTKIEGMILGKGVKTHEAMIALEKADVAFKLMNNIRGRITRAYEEIMRMQA